MPELLATDYTGEATLTRVNVQVSFQRKRVCKPLAAHAATEWFFTRVSAQMSFQVTRARKHLTTKFTAKRSFTAVN